MNESSSLFSTSYKIKRKTRIMLIQSVYMLLFDHEEQSIEVIHNNLLSLLQEKELSIVYDEKMFTINLTFIIKNTEFLDNLIKENINKNWDISRLDLLIIAILRTATAEGIYYPEINKNIIIDEYCFIAKLFISEDKINFINGIMDTILQKLRSSSQSQET